MAKYLPDAVLQKDLDYIAATGTRMDICSTQPTTFAEATTTLSLGSVVLAGGDWSIANGDVSGRKLTCAAKAGVSIAATGTAAHIAITGGASELLLVTTLATSQAVTAGNTADVATWKLEDTDVT